MTTAEKPLRKDAERNRRLILDAAAELFAQRGIGVTLNEIARHAGVGVGTVYRRFPDKSKLINELFEERLEEMVVLMEQAAADPDPWHGVVSFLEGANELQSRDLALRDLVFSSPSSLERICDVRDRLRPLGEVLVKRAQDAGALRTDIEATDMPIIQLMLSAVIDAAHDIAPDLWRRYLQIILQGLRADPEPPAELARPPLPMAMIDQVMATAKLGRR